MSDFKDDKIVEKKVRCPLCYAVFARIWSPSRKVHILACHFCKIAIAETDPFVGRWEEIAPMEKIPCPACDSDMRYFATSTGYMQAKCPIKKCQAKMESTTPDRAKGVQMFGADGEPIKPKGIDRPITTPENLGPTQ